MGNDQPSNIKKTEKDEIIKINHQRFLNYLLIEGLNKQEYIQIKIALPRQNEYDAWAKEIQKFGYQEPLLLPREHNFKKEGLCGTTGFAEISYENYPFLLIDEIHNRQCMSTKYFEQSELWYLVYTLLSAAEFFHSQGKKIGDVRPENIFISDDGSVKVACTYSWPLERTNYEKSFEKQITYIAPEEFNDLRFGKTQTTANIELAETFSIGLTLLDASTLSNSRDLYKNKKNIDYERLEQRLNDLDKKQQYNVVFKALVRSMCQVNPEARTTSRELFEWLKPYESAINNFQQFDPEEIPQKFQLVSNKTSINMSRNSVPITSSVYTSHFNNPMVNSNGPISALTYSAFQNNQPQSVFTFNPAVNQQSTGIVIGNGVNLPYKSQQGQVNLTYAAQPIPPQPQFYVNVPVQQSNNKAPDNYINTQGQGQIDANGYTPFTAKFNLDKIDAQLEQSRKLFPS